MAWPQHLEEIRTRCSRDREGGRCGAGRGLEQEKRAGPPELGKGVFRSSGENIWPPSAPLPVRHYYFCKLEQQIFTDSRVSPVCRDS